MPQPTVPSSGTIDLLETVAKPEELFVYYETTIELKQELAKHVKRMRGGEDRVIFASREEGLQYFRSLGRRKDKVFISNAAEANPCARPLSAALRRHNVFHFHYRYQTDIELAESWEKRLPERVRASRYFVLLVTKDYLQSNHCVKEYQLARELASAGQLSIIPYFLDSSSADIPEQGRDLSDMPVSAQARTIAKDLEKMLTKAT